MTEQDSANSATADQALLTRRRIDHRWLEHLPYAFPRYGLRLFATAAICASCVTVGQAQEVVEGPDPEVVSDQGWFPNGLLIVGQSQDGELQIIREGWVVSQGGQLGVGANTNGKVTVSGTDALWKLEDGSIQLGVGPNSSGILEIVDGGFVNGLGGFEAYIGFGEGASGEVTVSGTDSYWYVWGDVYVGYDGDGRLTIDNGGLVEADWALRIAEGAQSQGEVVVSRGATLDVWEELEVGGKGRGNLNIESGGTVVSWQGTLGRDAGSYGEVTVSGSHPDSGAKSSWNLDGQLTVGGAGTGKLTIDDNGQVIVTEGNHVYIAEREGSKGDVVVAGGGVLSITGDLDVGRNGKGTLKVESGGSVTNDRSSIGWGKSSYGEVTVSGASSTWELERQLYVGLDGEGRLAIIDGGQVNVGRFMHIAEGSEATGEVVVAGGAGLDITEDLDVGRNGTGTLSVLSGGSLTNRYTTIGYGAGSIGEVIVSGTGSTWTLRSLYVGGWDGNGEGHLTVADGGQVSVTSTLNVGHQGKGTLSVQSGGSVTSQTSTIGYGAGSYGEVIVSGAKSTWNVDGELKVGGGGEGKLTIGEGGTVTSKGAALGWDDGIMGTVVVSGPGALWQNTAGIFHVGHEGIGTLTIEKGGKVEHLSGADNADIGWGDDAFGQVSVLGEGSSWSITKHLSIGVNNNSTGILEIGAGGTVTNNSSYIGYNPGSYGEVTVSDAYSTWHVNGSLLVGRRGKGQLTITDGGQVNVGGEVVIAESSGSTGVLAIGAQSDESATAAGILRAATVRFGDGNGTLVFNHLDASYEFSPAISGSGNIDHLAGATIVTGDGSGFTGMTTVNGGTLFVNNNKLGGSAEVNDGGRLGGSGTIGSGGNSTVRVASGGAIAPGNSIDTFTVQGNLTFDPGARFEVEIDGPTSDLLYVTGEAHLNGTVHVSYLGGLPVVGSTYTILTAAGGIDGYFDAEVVSDINFAFLNPQLAYDYDNDQDHVILTFDRNGVAFCEVARTANQCATANALDGLDEENDVYKAVVSLNATDARAAFDSLSGEIHASLAGQLVNQSHFVRAAILARLLQAYQSGGSGTSMAAAPLTTVPMMALGMGSGDTAPSSSSGLALWAHGFGSWGSFDGNGNAAPLNTSTGGILTGMDGLMTDQVRVGLLAGYSHSSFDADERASSGAADSYHFGLYAGTQWGDLGFRSGLAYTWSNIETNRAVTLPNLTDRLSGDYDASLFQAFGELGYRLKSAAGTFEPFANLAYVNLDTDGFTEEGGAAALHSHGTDSEVTFTTVGVHAATNLDLGSAQMVIGGTLGWRHAFGDTLPAASLAFAGSEAFTIAGVPIAEDAAIIEAGLGLELAPNAALGLAYQGQIAEDSAQHGVKGDLTIRF